MDKITDVAMGVLVVASIFVLVRPGSKGPDLVSSVGSAFSTVIGSATGGGTWANG